MLASVSIAFGSRSARVRARVRLGRVRGRARVRPGRVRVVVCGLFFLVVSMIVPAVVSWSSQ